MVEMIPKFDHENTFEAWAVWFVSTLPLDGEDPVEKENAQFDLALAGHLKVLNGYSGRHSVEQEIRSLQFLAEAIDTRDLPDQLRQMIKHQRFEYHLRVVCDESGRYAQKMKRESLEVLRKALKNDEIPSVLRPQVRQAMNSQSEDLFTWLLKKFRK